MIVWMMTAALAAKVTCDPAALDKGVGVLAQLEARHHVDLAAAAILEGCKPPESLATGRAQLAQVSPDHRPMIDMQLTTLAPARVEASCPGGLKALGEMIALAPDKKRAHVWSRCKTALAPIVTEAEWSGATGLIAAPLIFGPWLFELGAKPEAARALGRALVGLSDRPKDNPKQEFAPQFP